MQKTWKYIHNVYSSISYSWNFCFISMNKKKFPLKFWTARPQITKIDSFSLFVLSVSLNFFYCSSKIRNSRSWMRWAWFFYFSWHSNLENKYPRSIVHVHGLWCPKKQFFCWFVRFCQVKWSFIANWFLILFSYYTVWFHD